MNELLSNDLKLEESLKSTISNVEDALAKIAITKEADRHVINILSRVNSEFEAGRVSKQDLISWIILKFAREISDGDIETIRVDHFDEMAFFDFLYKKAKKTGVVPLELKKAILSTAIVDNSKGAKTRSLKKKSDTNE